MADTGNSIIALTTDHCSDCTDSFYLTTKLVLISQHTDRNK